MRNEGTGIWKLTKPTENNLTTTKEAARAQCVSQLQKKLPELSVHHPMVIAFETNWKDENIQ